MPAGCDGTDAGEQLALFIEQLDPIPEFTDQLGDVLAIVERNWKERRCCILQFGPLEKNPRVWQLIIEATMVQVKVGMDQVANVPGLQVVPGELSFEGLL
jgi:hypothetical protein